MNPTKIGVFGSAFNPPTLGHLDVLHQAADHFDRILLVPSASHAFTKKLQPFADRVGMLHCFLNEVDLQNCQLELCTLEQTLLESNPDKPVYTFDLLEALEELYGKDIELSFIRGPDNADPQTWNRFYKAKDIQKRWTLFTAEERRPVRSSYVRELTALAKTDDNRKETLDGLLLPSVRDYILTNKLYQV